MKSMQPWQVYVLCLTGIVGIAGLACAEAAKPLPTWRVDQRRVDELSQLFENEQIKIRPPRGLKKIDHENTPELTNLGLHKFGWSPGGVMPSTENFSVALTPFSKPSSEALDKLTASMQSGIEKRLERVKFVNTRRGQFRGFEARAGTFTAEVSGEKVNGYFLVGIDKIGTYAIAAMLPEAKSTPERISTVQNAMLTFDRAGVQKLPVKKSPSSKSR
jgi:hypothetical protein